MQRFLGCGSATRIKYGSCTRQTRFVTQSLSIKYRQRKCRTACRAEEQGSSKSGASTEVHLASTTGDASAVGASSDPKIIWGRLLKLTMPYWLEDDSNRSAKAKLVGVVALTLATTGVSVMFNFLMRDFFTALSNKDQAKFAEMLVKWLCALCVGIPVYVFRDYYQNKLALEWREWMTKRFTERYFEDRSFYRVQAGGLLDNPDQRISSDVNNFTETALGFSMKILNALIDLISFSGILFSIYPPLFVALLVYSIGGTGVSLFLGRKLIGLNFAQEAQEANFRYGLVRVRENAESIAFYGGEGSERRLLSGRLTDVISNYASLLVTSRNLQFFTSFYRFVIQILPAAVVAPLYFAGKIDFGVINQTSSAFNHILGDVSIVVYQLESLAGFSAVIDRLGEFDEVVADPQDAIAAPGEDITSAGDSSDLSDGSLHVADAASAAIVVTTAAAVQSAAGGVKEGERIKILELPPHSATARSSGETVLLDIQGLSMQTPDGATRLVQNLDLLVVQGRSVLIVGSSGCGKTSLLRAIAGLWREGSGSITRYGSAIAFDSGGGDVFFLPQRPYCVLGSLRDQLLYPTWAGRDSGEPDSNSNSGGAAGNGSVPSATAGASAISANGSNCSNGSYIVNSSSNSSNGSTIGSDKFENSGNGKMYTATHTVSDNGSSSSSNGSGVGAVDSNNSSSSSGRGGVGPHAVRSAPSDGDLVAALAAVRLTGVLDRHVSAVERAALASGSMTTNGSANGSSSEGDNGGMAGGGVGAGSALDVVADWATILSLGEQQRLAFARVLLSKPRLVIMDESTSALDVGNEAALYAALSDRGITFVSVGHRPSLVNFHQEVLRLKPAGDSPPGIRNWEVLSAKGTSAADLEAATLAA